MRVLVIGSGGREHALAWKLAQSDRVTEIVSAPGSPGMARVGECVPIGTDDFGGLLDLATERRVDLTVVGPEAPLVGGIVDLFRASGARVFGPSRAAAEIEGSKVFSQAFCKRHGIPSAAGESFGDPGSAFEYAKTVAPPIVVKAEGLAAGKGVLVCASHDDARRAIDSMMREGAFGPSGGRVVIQEYLEGREISFFGVTDGSHVVMLEPAQDYKRALDEDGGLNTGGMGAYTPVPWLAPEVREQAARDIVGRAIEGLAEEGRPFTGCLYVGVMVTDKGPRLFEFNCRFGDPEIEALLPRMTSDLAELLDACVDGTLYSHEPRWSDEACVSVVIASGGYPESYETGKPIEGIDEAEALGGVTVFHAGTGELDGRLVSAGGRVLNVAALGPTIPAARGRAYEAVSRIGMPGMHFRRDIARGVRGVDGATAE